MPHERDADERDRDNPLIDEATRALDEDEFEDAAEEEEDELDDAEELERDAE